MRVLVVEDEEKIAGFVRRGLEEQGFSVDLCDRGDEAYDRIQSHPYDAVVLDIMLPGRDGLSVLRGLRQEKNPVPVILLTARSALDERVEGLNLGADDYLAKPFYVEELAARLHALMRRSAGKEQSVLRAGDLSVNLLTRDVRRGDRDVALTSREFNLLEYLMRSPGRVLTRTQIIEHVWGYHFDPNTNLVDVHIQRLRKKLDASEPNRFIETVRGVGYRFARPAETEAEPC
jgi:DNA-binding response OmpR family regulator